MTTWEIIAEKAKKLPPKKQLEVLNFLEALRTRAQRKGPLRSPAGLLKDLGIDPSEEDITEARRALWSTFRRKDVYSTLYWLPRGLAKSSRIIRRTREDRAVSSVRLLAKDFGCILYGAATRPAVSPC